MLQFGGSRAFYFFTPNFIQKTANFTINRYKQKKLVCHRLVSVLFYIFYHNIHFTNRSVLYVQSEFSQ